MKCPLLAFAWGNEGGKEPLVYPDCLKEECAWWSPLGGQCSIPGIHEELHWIAERLKSLVDKMPHENQFRK